MDYLEKYKQQLTKLSFPQFDKYLKLYYQSDDDFKRSMLEDGTLVLKNKKSEIKIKHGVYINLYTELLDIKNKKKDLINKLNNLVDSNEKLYSQQNSKEFDGIKKELIDIDNSINSINKIFEEKNNRKVAIYDKDNKLNHELYLIYKKRNKYFNNIGDISKDKFKSLRDVFDNEKNIDSRRVNILSKKLNITEKQVKCCINWMIASKKYIKLQHQVNNETIFNKEEVQRIEYILKHFLIKSPQVSIAGDKIIKVKKPVFDKISNDAKYVQENLEVEPLVNQEALDEVSEVGDSDVESDDSVEDEAVDEVIVSDNEEQKGGEEESSDSSEESSSEEDESEEDESESEEDESESSDDESEEEQNTKPEYKVVSFSNESLQNADRDQLKNVL